MIAGIVEQLGTPGASEGFGVARVMEKLDMTGSRIGEIIGSYSGFESIQGGRVNEWVRAVRTTPARALLILAQFVVDEWTKELEKAKAEGQDEDLVHIKYLDVLDPAFAHLWEANSKTTDSEAKAALARAHEAIVVRLETTFRVTFIKRTLS